MNYTRTDLCPTCNTRLNNIHYEHDHKYIHMLILDHPVYIEYKGRFYTTIKCYECRELWTKPQVQDFWIEKHKEHFDG